MTRVTRYKIGYVIALLALAGGVVALSRVVEPGPWLVATIVVVVLNNIGSAELGLGNLDSAEAAWNAALSLDPQYPLPHANLALVAAACNDEAAARRHLDTAQALGYSGAGFDRFVHQTQSVLAAVESRGTQA